jgi:hypothetical protein
VPAAEAMIGFIPPREATTARINTSVLIQACRPEKAVLFGALFKKWEEVDIVSSIENIRLGMRFFESMLHFRLNMEKVTTLTEARNILINLSKVL